MQAGAVARHQCTWKLMSSTLPESLLRPMAWPIGAQTCRHSRGLELLLVLGEAVCAAHELKAGRDLHHDRPDVVERQAELPEATADGGRAGEGASWLRRAHVTRQI